MLIIEPHTHTHTRSLGEQFHLIAFFFNGRQVRFLGVPQGLILYASLFGIFDNDL